MSEAQEHQSVAGHFSEIVDQVTDWDAPTPVAGWKARDVVGHLVTWLPGFLQHGAGIELPAVDLADPAQAWRQHTAAVQALLEDPRGRLYRSDFLGEKPVEAAIDQFYTNDVFMHTWDLARSQELDPQLDEARSEALLAGLATVDPEMLRGSGQYGRIVPVSDEAPAQERLAGFIGRDPAWRP
ncbi:maleylpyruvate isomerase N-terminal domain-containing protein [Nocardioides sp. Kera G14]|uniref:maleylpyruvate isomerase N-terminal domain-containing protein n=1 Tax=Nocardioides sp. Kera G14 TaxID=2884264 RepID=UPI001D11FDB5|nr:maleylpyruvate isomerase N-terminal domain-containing protein [Nocardioides sp. Kera G14]UDY24345.1 TIGR03086 family protein [Nocardioides sp. Kera G14]